MKRARNEIEGMALKAARGAGVPLGHAEDFARAIGTLAMTAPGEISKLTNVLSGLFDVASSDDPLTLDGPILMCAPLAIDALRAGECTVTLRRTEPEALLNAYLRNAMQDYDLYVKHSGGVLTALPAGDPAPLPTAPINIPDHIWQEWEALAAKTYVPETEESRLAGAGAGLTDND